MDSNQAAIWEQRVDPWMVFWPMLVVGLMSLSLTVAIVGGVITSSFYLSDSISPIDQFVLESIGIDTAKIIVAFSALLSLGLGAVVYTISMKEAHNEERNEIKLSKRFIQLAVLLSLVLLVFYYIIYYQFQDFFNIGSFLSDILVVLLAGFGIIIGLGFVLEYFDYSSDLNSKGMRIAVFIVRKGSRPLATEKLTDPIGGYFYMLLDRRVANAVLRGIPLSFGTTHSSVKSPDEIRRDQYLT